MKGLALAALASAAVACLPCGRALAAGAPAGVAIQNTAQVTYTIAGTSATTSSNTVSVTVAEILNVVTTLQSPTTSVAAGATGQVLVFRVTNTGNAPESYLLAMTDALAGDDFDPTPSAPAIYIDSDGSGTLTAADTPYVPGSNDPAVAPDAFVNILVVNNIPAGLADGNRGFSRLTATGRTGSGAPGTVFAGKGPGGTDAVVGSTGGTAQATGTYIVGAVQVTAVKTATVIQDPFGGAPPHAVPGARIRYQLVVNATGGGTAASTVVSDVIPANTTYLPGSLTLNGAALTDASDADPGAYLTSPSPHVAVTLGNFSAASGAQTITFTVTIN